MDQQSVSPILKTAAGVLALGGFLYVGRHYFGELERLSQARPAGMVAMVLIHLFTLYLQGSTLRRGLVPFGSRISAQQGFVLSVMSSYASLLVPRSGIATTAAYLTHKCQTRLIDFSSIVLYNAGLFVLCSSLLATALVLGDFSGGEVPEWWLLTSLPLLVVVSGAAVSIRWRMPRAYRGLGSGLLNRLCRASSQLVSPNNFWPLASLHALLTFLRAARLYAAFWALGIEVNPLGVLLASALGDLVFIFAVTPAALGFREAAITFSAGALATTSSLALSVALFDRLVFSGTVIVLAHAILTRFAAQARPMALPTAVADRSASGEGSSAARAARPSPEPHPLGVQAPVVIPSSERDYGPMPGLK